MTQPVVVFPDTEGVVISWLTERLADDALTVASRVPNPRPVRLLVVRRVGGPRRDLVTDEATLTIEAWAGDELDAHDLLQAARAELHALSGRKHDDVTVYRISEFAGPAALPDPGSKEPRYTMTVSVAARGVTPVGS